MAVISKEALISPENGSANTQLSFYNIALQTFKCMYAKPVYNKYALSMPF